MRRIGGFLRFRQAMESLPASRRCDHDCGTLSVDRSHLPATPPQGCCESDSRPARHPSPAAGPAAGPAPPVSAPSLGPKSQPQVSAPSLGGPGDHPTGRMHPRPTRPDRRTPKHPRIERCRPVRPPQAGPASAGHLGHRGSLASAGHYGHRGPARHPPAASAIVRRFGDRRPPRVAAGRLAPTGRLGHRGPARRPPAAAAILGPRPSLVVWRPKAACGCRGPLRRPTAAASRLAPTGRLGRRGVASGASAPMPAKGISPDRHRFWPSGPDIRGSHLRPSGPASWGRRRETRIPRIGTLEMPVPRCYHTPASPHPAPCRPASARFSKENRPQGKGRARWGIVQR
jgi:hypothetical protein